MACDAVCGEFVASSCVKGAGAKRFKVRVGLSPASTGRANGSGKIFGSVLRLFTDLTAFTSVGCVSSGLVPTLVCTELSVGSCARACLPVKENAKPRLINARVLISDSGRFMVVFFSW